MRERIVGAGIRPLVYGGFTAVLVPLAFVMLAATLAFSTIGAAFDRSAQSDAVVTAAHEIDDGTLVLLRLVDVYNVSGASEARAAVATAQHTLAGSIAGLKAASGGQTTQELTKLTNVLGAYARDIEQLDQLKHDEMALTDTQLEPLTVALTKRLETLSAATEANVRGDSVALSRRLLSAFLHVRLAADRALAMHDPDAYAGVDDVLTVLGSNLEAFGDRAEEILAGVDTVRQVEAYIELLGQATAVHQTIDALITGPMQSSGQELLALAATASKRASDAREAATNTARDRLGQARELLLGFGAAGLLVGAGAAWGIGRQISGGIRQITATMGTLAGGDLAVDPPFLRSGGEFGAMGRALAVFRDGMAERELLARERERVNRELRIQHVRFGAALSNMSEALCMFDTEDRLVVGNDRLATMLGLPVTAIPLTLTIKDMEAALMSSSGRQRSDITTLLGAISRLKAHGQRIAYIQDMADGRTLAVNFAPMDEDGWLVTLEDITQQRVVEARIAHMAHHDALTGLANRTLFQDRLGEAVARSRRGELSALLCLDLDHFKAVNDTLGHPIGDALLREVTQRLQRSVRETDTVARLGGDEFAIVQADISRPTDSALLAGRLVAAISAPYELDGKQVVIGVSIGVALIPDDGDNPDRLMKTADTALYQSKTDGRGQYRFYEPAMDERMQAQRTLERDLRRALEQDEFQVFYQAQVNIASGAVCGFEALLRWRHPERGLVSPADFIPLAERTRLIVPIGKWVLRRACEETLALPNQPKIAVNLSPVQFAGGSIVEDVVAILAETGFPARRLELEITETAILDDTDAVLATLHKLRDLGASIALDDFGTGYSSLSYLWRFPFDKIKIDRSFIAGLGKVGHCDTIVAAVVDLCERMGMVTLSEGVETTAQLEKLSALRCTEVQGYLFSRPCPIDEAAAMCGAFRLRAERVG